MKYQDFLKQLEIVIKNNDSKFYQNKNINDQDIFEKFNFTFQGKINKYKKNPSPIDDAIKEITEKNEFKNILKKIYNQDSTIKPVKNIINSDIDKKIKELIIRSKNYIKKIKITELEDKDIKNLIQILENLYKENITQLKSIEQLDKSIKKTKEKRINKSQKEINNLRSILMNVILNKKRKSK